MNSDDLKGSLRRALQAETDATPMPSGLLDIPGSWVRSPSRTGSGLALGVAALLGVVLGSSVVAAVATESGWLAPRVTLRDASVIAGIPLERMVQTTDGFVGVRGPTAARATVTVVFVPSSGGPARVLVERTVPGFSQHQALATFVLETLSCALSAGLVQPDYIFGYYESYAPDTAGVSAGKGGPASAMWVQPVIGHGAAADGSFVYVLDLPPPAKYDVRLMAGIPPDHGEAIIPHLSGEAFDHLDTCAE